MNKREIDLRILIADSLLHWRKLLLSMIIGGILFGIISYAFSYQKWNRYLETQKETDALSPEEESEIKLEAAIEKLTDAEILAVENIKAMEKMIASQKEYYKYSILMQMDASNVFKGNLIFRITPSDKETEDCISDYYNNLYSDSVLYEWLTDHSENHGLTGAQISELVSYPNMNRTVYMNETTEDIKDTVIILSVIANDNDTAETLLKGIWDFVNANHKEMEKKLGTHNISLVSMGVSKTVDRELLNSQVLLQNGIANNTLTVAREKAAFKDAQNDYYKLLIEEENAETVQTVQPEAPAFVNPVKSAFRQAIKTTVVGMVLIVLTGVVILFVRYITGTKLKALDNLDELYGIHKIALISKDKKKRMFSFVDQWILNFRDKNCRRFDESKQIEMAASAIKVAAVKENESEVYMIGCDLENSAMEICRKIEEHLRKDSIDVVILNNILYDSATMEKLNQAKIAVIVETVDNTLYDELLRENELIRRLDITLLGGILVEQ